MASGVSILHGQGVTLNFGGLVAVDNADFHVERGEIVGLIGPNGAGKTTLFNIISGALRPRSGVIRFMGRDITGQRPDEIARMGLARTFQTSKVFSDMTPFENVRLALIYGNPQQSFTYKEAENQVNRLMAQGGMLSDRNKPTKELSLASQRRLEVVRALAMNPEMLLLDEVMAGLTPTEMAQSMKLVSDLRERGITIFMVEHVMQAIMGVCDRIIVLHFGQKVAEGTPAEVAADPAVKAIYLGS